MADFCKKSGKRMLDKKGALTTANAGTRAYHKKMREYYCEDCGSWHVATVNPAGYDDRKVKTTINDKRIPKDFWGNLKKHH